jgi:hypothetical protein
LGAVFFPETQMNDDIRRAVDALRNSPDLDDVNVYKILLTDGVEGRLAARLVEFEPMAYCRLLLAKSGAKFSDNYRRKHLDGTISPQAQFSNERLWNEVTEFAQSEIENGIDGRDLAVVAGRSAEFEVANRLIRDGSKLQDILFAELIFTWPELGPDIET